MDAASQRRTSFARTRTIDMASSAGKPSWLEDIGGLVAEMRDAFETGILLPIDSRRQRLRRCSPCSSRTSARSSTPCGRDLRRPTGETVYYDFLLVKSELRSYERTSAVDQTQA